MRLKAIRAFIDRYTGKPYNPGDIYESDSVERIKQLQEAGYLERVPLPLFKVERVETAVKIPEENARIPKRRRRKR